MKDNYLQQIDSPALLVYPEIVKANIAEMVRMAGTPERLRPHIKTHKTAEGIKLMQEAGISKFKCATIAEAELLATQDAKDVLLAHQPIGPRIERLLQLVIQYPDTKFSCITDHPKAAEEIGRHFQEHGKKIGVFIDVNVGMNRTGIAPDTTAVNLYRSIMENPGLMFEGLHVYDGHHRQNDPAEKEKAVHQSFEPVHTLINLLREKGATHVPVVAGGSPTFSIHAKQADRDCSPGTNIFWDHGYGLICPEQDFRPAVRILTRVISLPSKNRICLDLGHKAVASENDITRRIFFPDAPGLRPVAQSEEHLVMESSENHGYQPGDVLIGIPYHVCPTVALHETLFAIDEEQRLAGEWKVAARKRKISI